MIVSRFQVASYLSWVNHVHILSINDLMGKGEDSERSPLSQRSSRTAATASFSESHTFKSRRFTLALYFSLGVTFLIQIGRFVLIMFVEDQVVFRE